MTTFHSRVVASFVSKVRDSGITVNKTWKDPRRMKRIPLLGGLLFVSGDRMKRAEKNSCYISPIGSVILTILNTLYVLYTLYTELAGVADTLYTL
jgi:hypothetical protein